MLSDFPHPVSYTHLREYDKLPKEARNYVEYLERELGCPITYVSVGAERDAIIRREKA